MKHKHFLATMNEEQITAAIGKAEKNTSGEIRVFISHHRCPDPLPIAAKHFERLGMAKTKHRNGILIFVAPQSRTFALLGDSGIHEKCGDEFWQALRDQMIPHLQSGQYTDGIIHAIDKAGELLAAHFPISSDDDAGDELPNSIAHD